MRVLVTGACGPAGRALLNQLRDREVSVVGADLVPRRRTDGIDVLRALPADAPGYGGQLKAMAEALMVDLVIPTVSEELPIVSQLNLAKILVGSPAATAIAADKWHTYLVLAAAGVAVPRSVCAADLDQALTQWIGIPLITKPRVSRGARGVTLHRTWPPVDAVEPSLLVSEFIPGEEYCPQVFIGDDPATDLAVVLKKTSLTSGDIGNAQQVSRVRFPRVGELAIAACRAIGLSGVADVDIRLRQDGRPVVLEINARFGANSASAPEVLSRVLEGPR